MSPVDVIQNGPIAAQDFDKELKKRQIAKIDLEITQLTRLWPRVLEVVHKIAVPALALLAMILAFWLNIPQNEMRALKAEKTALGAEKKATAEQKNASAAEEATTKALAETKTATEKLAATSRELAQIEGNIKAAEKDIAELQAQSKKEVDKLSNSQQVALFSGQVFIQFKGELLREDINSLRGQLKTAGLAAPPAERIDRGQGNEVRYFSDTADERKRAEQTEQIVRNFFAGKNCPIADLKVNLHKLPAGKPSPLEVWLNHSCRVAR